MNSRYWPKLLDEQARLGLDQQPHLELLGHFDAGHQLVVKICAAVVPRLLGRQLAARLGRDVRRPSSWARCKARLVCSRRMAR